MQTDKAGLHLLLGLFYFLSFLSAVLTQAEVQVLLVLTLYPLLDNTTLLVLKGSTSQMYIENQGLIFSVVIE